MKIKLLPLDERPCNTTMVSSLGEINEQVMIKLPNENILGNKKNPAKFEQILDFIKEDINDYDYLIISMDMFLYGGLLPSRLHNLELDVIYYRLELLEKLRKESGLKIYSFSTIMRTPKYNSSDEEPDYYELYGASIFKKKFLEDKLSQNGTLSNSEYEELNKLSIPFEYEEDYSHRRKINLEVNLKIVEMLEKEVFEYLIFPQDDSAEYGYTRIDQEQVYNSLNSLSKSKYSVHPGADEVAMTLLSRVYIDHEQICKKIFVVFENEDSKNMIPNYEDRTFAKSLKLHLNAANLIRTEDINDADELLYINLSSSKMLESFDQDFTTQKSFNFERLKDRNFFVHDNAYSNGGDLQLIKTIFTEGLSVQLQGYSAWNTSSNSLGTILCQITMNDKKNVLANQIFTYERLIDDGFYQPLVRMKTNKLLLPTIGLNYFDLKNQQNKVIDFEKKELNDLIEEILKKEIEFTHNHPWNRMFEISLKVMNIKEMEK